MATEPLADDPAILEELSAYLDGELDGDARLRVEHRLASDPAYREALQRLQQTWDLLDRLPQATVDDGFTQTTLEMVALAAADDAQTEAVRLPRVRSGLWLAGAAAVVGAATCGWGAGRLVWPDPNRQLLQDLPVIEQLDQYHHADSIDFLRRLDREGLFPVEVRRDG